ncbi:MAG TPA: DUF4411 family protein [Defluviitoga tunisiensis]|nr:DUF4411 family protein [Defluviitoga tunisiensis]
MNNDQKIFVLDSSIFIEAYKRYYAFDIAPSFWEKLIELGRDGKICSIDRVRNELIRKDDELKQWIQSSFYGYFHSTEDNKILIDYRELMEWSYSNQQFTEEAKHEFAKAEIADAWLIAYAKAYKGVVATEERLNLKKQSRIPIPNVCKEFDIECVDTFQMLRQLKVQL